MSKKRIKIAVGVVLALLCFISIVMGLLIASGKGSYANAESVKNETNIFTFAKTSEDECSVRLKDKTVITAIIPEKVELEGKEYTVTSITANGFASATSLQKVRLPKTVKTIGQSAFSGCKALVSLTLNAVESIGTNAFATTNLEYLIIPETVTQVASTILRNCDTQVYVRASLSDGATLPKGTWATNWNTANTNQNVEYGSDYIPEIKYKEVMASQSTYKSFSLLNEAEDYVIGYDVDEFQEFCSANTNEYNELYIPATYNGKPVVGIANSAFYDNDISKIVIGYSANPITISSFAFDSFNGNTIVINRDIVFEDNDNWGTETVISENVFANSNLSCVILPDTINNLGNYMFMGCSQLTDIKFAHPKDCTKDEEMAMLNNIEITNTVDLPSTENFTSIGSYTFCDTPNIKNIYIHKNVQYVGDNILSGWNYTNHGQKAIIDFSNENLLPAGWNALWNQNCEEEVIEYNDLSEYTITYIINKEGAVHTNPTIITRKDSFTLKDAKFDGHIFIGWYNNAEFKGDKITEIKSGTKENLTLYGYMTEITYQIHYDENKPQRASNGVIGAMPNQTNIRYGQIIQLFSNDYQLEGWRFVEWNTKRDGSGTRYAELAKVKDLTKDNNDIVDLYAQWEEKTYTIKYEKNRPSNASHEVGGNEMSSTHMYEDYDNLLNNTYTLTGWRFVKWTEKKDGSGNSYSNHAQIHSFVEEGEVKLYAQWEAYTYYVSYYAKKSCTGSTSRTTHKYDTESSLATNGFQTVSFNFDYWTTSSGIRKNTAYNLTETNGDTVYLYAHWSPKSLNYCYNSSGIYEIADISQLKQLSSYSTNNWSFMLTSSFDVGTWTAISEFNGVLDLNNYTITYSNTSISHAASYGFIITNNGTIKNGSFKPSINVLDGTFADATYYYIGGVCAVNKGSIQNCTVLSKIGRGSETFTSSTRNVDIYIPVRQHRVGGIAGENNGTISYCTNNASIGGDIVNCGGIAGASWNTSMTDCINWGNLYVEQRTGGSSSANYFGGITGIATGPDGFIIRCTNYGNVDFHVQSVGNPQIAYMAQIAGMAHTAVKIEDCNCYGNVSRGNVYIVGGYDKYITNEAVGQRIDYNYGGSSGDSGGGCVATGTYITLADGTKKLVEDLKGNEELLVWNLFTGTFDVAPILFVDSDSAKMYEVINLYFSDGTEVKVISEHAFWDFNLNEYVFLRNDAQKYIGHWFNKQTTDNFGELSWTRVQLENVIVQEEYTTAWSPVTYGHLCYYVNDMLSMPGATEGLINIFEVDNETLKINEVSMQAEIETYGLFTYEEFAEIYPITKEIFEAFNGKYLKISIGKGLITIEKLGELINHYAEFLS